MRLRRDKRKAHRAQLKAQDIDELLERTKVLKRELAEFDVYSPWQFEAANLTVFGADGEAVIDFDLSRRQFSIIRRWLLRDYLRELRKYGIRV